MKPSDYYAQDVAQGIVQEDPTQEQVLIDLDRIYNALHHAPVKTSWFKKILPAKTSPPKGLYIWGSVGRGKTYLMDIFCQSLDVPKLRQHFYEFMANVHAELKMQQGHAEPLKLVAAKIAKRAKVLCLDEFFVEDIADAMILSSFIFYLLSENVVIVTTSNVAPDDLYEDGLQRDRFIPAIAMLKEHLQITHLDHEQDYRLTKALCDHRYHSLLKDADAFLAAQFKFFNHDAGALPLMFQINQRDLEAVNRSKNIVWLEFHELCMTARSSNDYLQLCKDYQVILVSHIPALTTDTEDAARRFMALVDTCYDQHVLLVLAAAVPLEQLYQGTQLTFEFARVQSRIIEMQSWKL
jgi:cell division protein ZapE